MAPGPSTTSSRPGSHGWRAGAAPRALIASALATGANTLYLNAYPLEGPNRAWLQEVSRLAHDAGLSVQLLLGEPSWIDASTREALAARILRPLGSLLESTPGQRPTLHLDVEPHARGPMTEAVMQQYLDLLTWVRGELGPGVALEVDVPIWYGSLSLGGRPLCEAILEHADGVTLMAYERDAAQIAAEAEAWLAAAAARGKRVVIGVEAGEQRGVDTTSRAKLSSLLRRTSAALGTQPGFGGLALHGTEALRRLAP